MAKPRYIDPAGDHSPGLSVKPPFTFQGVTCRAFPLRANMARLTKFCDDYLNNGLPPDSQISLATGLGVYGWPKVLSQVESDIPLWTTNPRAPLRLFPQRPYISPRLCGRGGQAASVDKD
jgi:hypothetical protein